MEGYSLDECYDLFINNIHLNKGDIMAKLINYCSVPLENVEKVYYQCKENFLYSTFYLKNNNMDKKGTSTSYPWLSTFEEVKYICNNLHNISMSKLSKQLNCNAKTLKQHLQSLGFIE